MFAFSLSLPKHQTLDRWMEGKQRKRNVGWLLCLDGLSIHCKKPRINTIYVASISLIKKREGWGLHAKQLYSMDYTGIRALAVKSWRSKADRKKNGEKCGQGAADVQGTESKQPAVLLLVWQFHIATKHNTLYGHLYVFICICNSNS